MKKIVNIAISTALFGIASIGYAATGNVCTGGAAAAATVTDASSDFAVTDINVRCSQNVFLSFNDSTTAIGVGAGSAKGKNAFKGNSAGGAITVHQACAATGCTQTNATSAASQGIADSTATGT